MALRVPSLIVCLNDTFGDGRPVERSTLRPKGNEEAGDSIKHEARLNDTDFNGAHFGLIPEATGSKLGTDVLHALLSSSFDDCAPHAGRLQQFRPNCVYFSDAWTELGASNVGRSVG